MEPHLRQRALGMLHYALLPEGYLVLGPPGLAGDGAPPFSVVDAACRIYAKPPGAAASLDASRAGARVPLAARAETSPQALAGRKLLDGYAPPSVVVNDQLEVQQFRGDMGPFLAPASGAATLSLAKLLRPELYVELHRAAGRALDGAPGPVDGAARVEAEGPPRTVTFTIWPLDAPEGRGRSLLVVFGESRGGLPEVTNGAGPTETVDARLVRLGRDLAQTRAFLQATIEELEASNEELKATNEELQASNEELRSANDAIASSRDALQSSMAELAAVNQELRDRVSAALPD